MRKTAHSLLRHTFLFAVLTAAVLAVSNPDIAWYPVTLTVINQHGLVQKNSGSFKSAPAKPGAEDTSALAQLQSQMAQDDLGDSNPFSNLSTEVPFEDVYKAGVVRFERQALRSRTYRDESGYDLVHYEVELESGRKAHILAYLERTIESLGSSGEPAMAAEIPVVVVAINTGADTNLSVYRDRILVESSAVSSGQADELLARRLKEGIPFLSVAQ